MGKIKKYYRKIIQFIALCITNFNIKGLFSGRIFNGKTKSYCVPGLNCYSCPAAGFSCPLGTLQQVFIRIKGQINTYVFGWILLFSTLFGRVVCGFLCPFGLIQELLYKIPTPKIKRAFKPLRWVKYAVLVIFVIAIPIIVSLNKGIGYPAFCKYICPQGTIAGSLLMSVDEKLRSQAGSLFTMKVIILIIIIIASILIFRPFCRFICPLGAIYGIFNSIALIQIKVNPATCSNCGACSKNCPVRINPVKECNSPECMRCGKCVDTCPNNAIGFSTNIAISKQK